jgi:hypothetical protein
MKKYQQQKDLKGCGIACIANLLGEKYESVKSDFEEKFYKIDGGVKMFDIVNYLNLKGLKYKSKFFNQNKKCEYNRKEGLKFSRIPNSITLIAKSEKYKVGHYLLRVKKGWVDPWINFTTLDKARAGIRKKLPGNAWYVLFPIDK